MVEGSDYLFQIICIWKLCSQLVFQKHLDIDEGQRLWMLWRSTIVVVGGLEMAEATRNKGND